MRLLALLPLAGCQLVFEHRTEVAIDAALAEGIAPDVTAVDCPGYLVVGKQESRYRLIGEPAARTEQALKCAADDPSAHLLVIDSIAEAADMTNFVMNANLAWVGIRQAPSSPDPPVGWVWDVIDQPLDVGIINWAPNEPDDGGGGENNLENVAALGVMGLVDLQESDPRSAICECR